MYVFLINRLPGTHAIYHLCKYSMATEMDQLYNDFSDSIDFLSILSLFDRICDSVDVDRRAKPRDFYAQLKTSLSTWKSRSLWELLDRKASLSVYDDGRACTGGNVLIVGAGPCGLRFAVEAALLGANRVVVVEKRTSFSRNNVLHLWPFTMEDLRSLGAKKFFGKFGAGGLDHISIRILQAVLLKICLVLGVHVHSGAEFHDIIEPSGGTTGWTADVRPPSVLNGAEFDVVVGADGRRSSLLKRGFRQKEFRAKLAIAITANFVNGNTTAEAAVPELPGVSYVYKRDFFDTLSTKHGIELENIVYYKDETHYFVMTAKKASLVAKKVLKQDSSDAAKLLSSSNINVEHLCTFALQAAKFATEDQLPAYEFKRTLDGKSDVALFDFTSMYAADSAAKIIERNGKRIMIALVGDSLLEPFWPMGTGCARGFLSCMDTAWMMKRFFASDFEPMKLLEQREVLLNLLPQTTTTRLHANHAAYTIDPETRYLSAMDSARAAPSCAHLYDCGGSSQNGPLPAAKTTTEPAKKRVKTTEMKMPSKPLKISSAPKGTRGFQLRRKTRISGGGGGGSGSSGLPSPAMSPPPVLTPSSPLSSGQIGLRKIATSPLVKKRSLIPVVTKKTEKEKKDIEKKKDDVAPLSPSAVKRDKEQSGTKKAIGLGRKGIERQPVGNHHDEAKSNEKANAIPSKEIDKSNEKELRRERPQKRAQASASERSLKGAIRKEDNPFLSQSRVLKKLSVGEHKATSIKRQHSSKDVLRGEGPPHSLPLSKQKLVRSTKRSTSVQGSRKSVKALARGTRSGSPLKSTSSSRATVKKMASALSKLCVKLPADRAELALEVLASIIAVIENFPHEEDYQRLDINSPKFKTSVWDSCEAQDFLLASGWMPFGDFIVFPVDLSDAHLTEAFECLQERKREFQRKLWRGAVTGGFGLFSAKQSTALVNAIKTKMTAKRLSYTAALVEVAANRLLKQEDELEKFNLRVEKRGETKEPLVSTEAIVEIERRWNTPEKSPVPLRHHSTSKEKRVRRHSYHESVGGRRATFSAVLGADKKPGATEATRRKREEEKARNFLKQEKEKRRLRSLATTDGGESGIPDEVDGGGDDVFARTDEAEKTGNVDVVSSSSLTRSTFVVPSSMGSAKAELERLAAELEEEQAKYRRWKVARANPVKREKEGDTIETNARHDDDKKDVKIAQMKENDVKDTRAFEKVAADVREMWHQKERGEKPESSSFDTKEETSQAIEKSSERDTFKEGSCEEKEEKQESFSLRSHSATEAADFKRPLKHALKVQQVSAVVEQTSEREAGAVVEQPCQAAEEIAKPTSREEEDLTIQGSIGAKEKLKSKIKDLNI